MEATWSTMEKKEKIMWIKKAAEDQKRYEVSGNSSISPAFRRPLEPSDNELVSLTEGPVRDALTCSVREEDEV